MKKYYLLLLFVTSFMSAQIVNIPDANFKAKLLSSLSTNTVAGNLDLSSHKIDQNGDGQIQFSEALLVGRIDISESNITDLTGIEKFVNLKHLICNDNQIASLNVSPFADLTVLYCHHNLLTTLDINMLNNIEQIRCNSNFLTTLDVSGLVTLTSLHTQDNELIDLNLEGLVNLLFLDCKINQLSSLDLTGLTSLEYIFAGLNEITALDVSDLSAVKELYLNTNQMSSLDLTGLITLENLTISSNLFTSVNLTGLNLKQLDCKNNFLTTLDVSAISTLEYLNCNNNQLQTLDLNNCTSLSNFYCGNNDLTSLFIKNGVNESILSFPGNPNLQFICADESQINSIQTTINTLGMDATVSNSYCSFTPGGNYNTITGSMKFDTNNNGCDATDLPQPNIKININDGTNQGATFTNNLGNYNFFTQTGSFTLTPDVENPSWFNFSPSSATIPFVNNDDNVVNQNFCLSANGIHPDLEIVIVPILPARPGFDAIYKIVYKNKGNQTVQGFVNFTFNDNVLDFVSSSVVPNSTEVSALHWTVPNIAPFQSGTILVTLNVNSPQETPAVNIGDVLAFNAFIDVSTDDIWTDNTFDFNQTVVGSYDPNDITCLQGNSLPLNAIGKYLHYNIRFENTGTASAENIVVKNTIDLTQYDIQSLQIMESSHPMEVKVTGNIAEFIFQSIDLDTGGHGNILLKLKSNVAMPASEVINSADIYFDYNFPIFTNDEQTVFADLSKNDFVKDNSIQVYPNPTENTIHVKADNVINSIALYDVQGRILTTKLGNENAVILDLSAYSSGIYYLNITTEKGKHTQKIIKK